MIIQIRTTGHVYPKKTDKKVDTVFIYPTVYINPAPDAPASENKGDRLPVMKENEFIPSEFLTQSPGHSDARLDVERGVVVCTTLPERYVTPVVPGDDNLFGPASLHVVDYTAYWDNLRENVRTKIKAYLG